MTAGYNASDEVLDVLLEHGIPRRSRAHLLLLYDVTRVIHFIAS